MILNLVLFALSALFTQARTSFTRQDSDRNKTLRLEDKKLLHNFSAVYSTWQIFDVLAQTQTLVAKHVILFVLFDIDPPGAGEHGLVASWLLLSHSWLCSALQHVGLGLPGSFIFSHLYFELGDISFSTEGAFSSVIGRFPSSYMGAMMQVQGTIHLAPC